MPRPIIKLVPKRTEVMTDLPLGFHAAEDLAAGNQYMGLDGKLVSQQELDKQLRAAPGRRRVVRVPVQYYMPGDDKAGPPRETVLAIPVVGNIDSEELGRIVQAGVRNLHDAIRRQTGGKEQK